MKKCLCTLMLLAIGLVMTTSQAFAFSIIDPLTGDSYLGEMEIKFNNYDFGTVYTKNAVTGNFDPINNPGGGQSLIPGAAPVAGDGVVDSFGIATVTSIQRFPAAPGGAPANTLWTPTLSEALEISFYGLDDIAISADGKTLDSGATAGAYFRVYLDNTPDMDYTTGIAGFPNNVGNAGDILLLDARWVPGVSPVAGSVYSQTLDNSGANPPYGSGEGYLEVVGGTLASLFDTNQYLGGTADLWLKTSFTPDGTGAWTVLSHDPMRAVLTPEPASMLLMSVGLLGIGGIIRRRKVS